MVVHIAPIFILLRVNQQFRTNLLAYIRSQKPIFNLSIDIADSFPLPLDVRQLVLWDIEFDKSTFQRQYNPEKDFLPTKSMEDAIKRFREGWTNHHTEERTLIIGLTQKPQYFHNGRKISTCRTVVAAFAPLGRAENLKVVAPLEPWYIENDIFVTWDAFKTITRTICGS